MSEPGTPCPSTSAVIPYIPALAAVAVPAFTVVLVKVVMLPVVLFKVAVVVVPALTVVAHHLRHYPD